MTNPYMPISKTDEWATPGELFKKINQRYAFTLDAAASQSNHLCEKWYGLDHEDNNRRNGLAGDWTHETVWINPPYGRGIGAWVEKAAHHGNCGGTAVMLLPSRTDTKWFHEYCQQGEVEFIKGRLKFGGHSNSAPFPSIIVSFKP